MFGGNRRDVRVMMLHRDHLFDIHLVRELRREILRVHVTHRDARTDAVESLERREARLPVLHGFERLEIADVLTDEDLVAVSEREGVLEVRAHSHQGYRRRDRQSDW